MGKRENDHDSIVGVDQDRLAIVEPLGLRNGHCHRAPYRSKKLIGTARGWGPLLGLPPRPASLPRAHSGVTVGLPAWSAMIRLHTATSGVRPSVLMPW